MDKIYDFYKNAQNLLSHGYYITEKRTKDIISMKNIFKENCLIGEIKFRSPQGKLSNSGIDQIVELYRSNHLKAISVLTEPNFFGGSLSYIRKAEILEKPILMKDFIIDRRQILSGYSFGADAVLIIIKLTRKFKIPEKKLISFAKDLGMDLVIEVNSILEYLYAISLDPSIIGVNTRNLNNFSIEFSVLEEIAEIMDRNIPHVAMSGFDSKHKIEKAFHMGYSGVLIGSALMKEPENFLKTLGDING